LHATSEASHWAVEHQAQIDILRKEGKEAEAVAMEKIGVMQEPKEGGPLGVMDWTGPGVWTDAVLRWVSRRRDFGIVRAGVVWLGIDVIQWGWRRERDVLRIVCSGGAALIKHSYLRVQYGVVWTDLKDLSEPLRVGDVVILPGKSPLPSAPISHYRFAQARVTLACGQPLSIWRAPAASIGGYR
jgi:alpha 1,6-mannosyltransferase